jgi:DNA repair protein RadD
MTFTPRRHQTECADAIDDAFRAGITRPLANMCVASGKSIAMATTALRNWQRGERTIILSHRQELVAHDKKACEIVGVQCGINAAKLGERVWRAPVISAMIQSVHANAHAFGPVQNILIDECHLVPHSEAGMYRAFLRGFPGARIVGYSGTTFRLQSGSLVGPEGALFQREVYRYDIPDGIRDEYLVPGFSAQAVDKVDESKLKKTAGEYTAASQDAQMIALMDSHICQMKLGGADRRSWLIFEASQKAAIAMVERLNAWGIPAAVIIDKTKNREAIIDAFNSGRLRALVNVESLTTGFDSQRIDLVCFRRRTMSLGLYIQMCGRGLRTIGGNLAASIAAGKSDCLYYDFAGLVDQHGPLDFIRPKDTIARLTSCDSCGKRNASAAARCWSCDEPMTKLCPACLSSIQKGTLDCPECAHDMRTGSAGSPTPQKLLDTPSGAALISNYKVGSPRDGGWLPVRKAWSQEGVAVLLDADGGRWELPPGLARHAADARWVRGVDGTVAALLKMNGASRNSALQVSADGAELPVPMPAPQQQLAVDI